MYIYRARVATIMDKEESTADLRKKVMNEKVSKFEIQGKKKSICLESIWTVSWGN